MSRRVRMATLGPARSMLNMGAGLWAIVLLAGTPQFVLAQNVPGQNPVFVNDSPAASDALIAVRENLARGNLDQAVRLAQRLLDDHAGSLVATERDGSLFTTVRTRVHELLLGDGEFLARYRRAQTGPAKDVLDIGGFAEVARTRFLTPAGLAAALRGAVEDLEAGRFDSALLALREIDRHPDRGGVEGASSVAVAAVLARYLPAARELANSWGGGDGEAAMVRGPMRPVGRSPLTAAVAGDPSAIVAQPLSTVPFGMVEANENGGGGGGARSSDDAPVFGRSLRVFPALLGDTVFVSSGDRVSAFDRFTLSPRWTRGLADVPGVFGKVREDERGGGGGGGGGGFRQRFGGALSDDARVLTVSGSLLLAVASADAENSSDTRQALAALEPGTGRLLWSRAVQEIDPQLERGMVRGPVMLDPSGTVAAVAVRKNQRDRRLNALYLAVVETADGTPRWSTLVASIGALPFLPSGQMGDGALIADGVIYAVDRLGVACAYEVSSGRAVWVRRFPGESYDAPFRPSPWQVNLPIVRGDEVIVLAPDRRSVVWLDRATGKVNWTLDIVRESPVGYILALGEKLALVGETQVALASMTRPEAPATRVVHLKDAPQIRGRVVVVGERLLVPLERGLAVITADGGLTTQPLDESGNLLLADDQLIVADDARLHSYLSWESADRLLTARIESSPSDPGPGIALAEVAYRAGRDARILTGVDAASAALVRKPEGEAGATAVGGAGSASTRLVTSVRMMIDVAQAGTAPEGREPLSREVTGQLVERFGRLAKAAPDRAAYALVAGRHAEDVGESGAAAASYQQVLDDAELAGALWQGSRLGVRAETEATRRLEHLVGKAGAGAYAPFDAAASAAAAALPLGATAEEIERLARRYPVASVAPTLWGKVAAAHEVERRSRAAARALEIGLQTAQRIPGLDPRVPGELAGQLLTNFVDRGLLFAADECLRRVRATFGEIALTLQGVPMDANALAARIGTERSLHQRWPTLGMPVAEGAQVLPGWAIMEPVSRESQPSTPGYLAMRHQDGRIAVFARGGGVAGADEFAPIWVKETESQQAELLRQDRGAAFFYSAQDKAGGVIIKVDPVTGKQLWATDGLVSAFPPVVGPQPGGGAGVIGRAPPLERVPTPLEGMRPPSEVLFSSDERTLAMVERGGRGVAYDADSGQRLWAAAFPMVGVFDAAVFRNLLVVAGEAERPGAAGRARHAVLLVLDARTGELLRTVNPEIGSIRWVRFTPRGELIVGMTGAVAAIDPETGQTTWRNTQAPCVATQNAWALGDNMLLQAEGRVLWLISSATGLLRPAPVDVRDKADTAVPPRPSVTAEGHLALSTPAGLAIVAGDGSLKGADAVGQGENLLPPVAADGAFYTIEVETTSRDRTVPAAYNLHVLDASSAMLKRTVPVVLAEPPQRMVVMDGRLVVTAGHFTIVYAAPGLR